MKTLSKSSLSAALFLVAFFSVISAASAFMLISGDENDLCTAPAYEGETEIIGMFAHNFVLLPYRGAYEFRPASGEEYRLPLTDKNPDINRVLALNIGDENALLLPTDRVIKIKINAYTAFCEGTPQATFLSYDETFPSRQGNFVLIAGNPFNTCTLPTFRGDETLTGAFLKSSGDEMGSPDSGYGFVVYESDRGKLPLQNIQSEFPWFNKEMNVENIDEAMPLIEGNVGKTLTIAVDRYSAYCEGVPTLRVRMNFPDVSEDYPFQNAVQFIKGRDIVSGYPDGTFKPEQSVNRAEFTKIVLLSRFTEHDLQPSDNCFKDVHDEWFAPYVCTAKLGGVLKGYPDGDFRPEQTINLAEALKILMQLYGLEYEETNPWYEGIMTKAGEEGLIPFSPADPGTLLTRGQMAALAAAFLQR